MSADGAVGGDAAPDAGGGDAGAGGGYTPPNFGSVDEIREALDFDSIEDLAPGERPEPAAADPQDEVAAKRDGKGRFAKGDEPAVGKDAKADAGKGEPEDDVAIVKQIEARSKARRLQREAARRAHQPAPAAAQPAAAAKPADPPPAEAKAPAPSRQVESAVRDVLAAIDKLAAGDADATSAEQGGDQAGAAAAAAERKQLLAGVNEKLDALKKAAEVSEEAKQQLAELQTQVKAINNDRAIRARASQAITAVADDVPTLLDPKALRAFNKEHGTKYVDATEMVAEAAVRFFERFKKTPDWELLAKSVEKKLKGSGPEKTATDEKPTPTRKTVSRSDGSPPATRGRDDERSHEEAVADFNRRFGLDD